LRLARTALWVRSDARLLHQILGNLLSNALRYTAAGKVLVGCRRRGTRVEIQVWDTGIGIPEHEQAHVYDERYRASNAGSASDASRGLGLGLAIARRSATLIGASLGLRSKPGCGSMFSVSLPVCEPPPSDS
jgi:signal transduction histidine kinase